MTKENNIRAILETCFPGFKEELIDSATNRLMEVTDSKKMIDDTISRQAAIDALGNEPEVWSGKDEYEQGLNNQWHYDINALKAVPSADIAPRWIPVTERLPEEDKEVLISYRYKEGEGNTSHSEIDITSYGQMYFGGNKVGNNKHWRAPFEYFYSNYEVIAWMPLPSPYKEGE